MCFSFEVSIATFFISWGISIYLLNKNLSEDQRHSVKFLMLFSSIQIVDAILWYNKMKKNRINYIVTSFLLPMLLSLQILYNVYVYNKNKNNIINLFVLIACLYLFYRFNGYTKSLCNSYFSSPIWGGNEIKLWEIFIFAILIIWPRRLPLFMVFFLIIHFINFFIGGSYGSLWCAIATLHSFIYLYNYK